MAEKARYVRCRVSPGFFETEFYVVLHNASAFVNRHNVRVKEEPRAGSEVEGEVLAYVIDEARDRGQALVELAGEPVVGGLRSWVPTSELAAA